MSRLNRTPLYNQFSDIFSAFGQHVDANGQINFAGADMAGSSYLPGEAVFLPASMAAASEAAAAFSQPDLPPVAAGTNVQLDPATSCNVVPAKKGTAKSKTSGKKAKQGQGGGQGPGAGGVGVNITPITPAVAAQGKPKFDFALEFLGF